MNLDALSWGTSVKSIGIVVWIVIVYLWLCSAEFLPEFITVVVTLSQKSHQNCLLSLILVHCRLLPYRNLVCCRATWTWLLSLKKVLSLKTELKVYCSKMELLVYTAWSLWTLHSVRAPKEVKWGQVYVVERSSVSHTYGRRILSGYCSFWGPYPFPHFCLGNWN